MSEENKAVADELDSFLEGIGLDVRPISPEHAFMLMQTGGSTGKGYQKIHNFRWWLRHEIFGWFDMVEQGVPPCKKVLNRVTAEWDYELATREEYAMVRTKYYLRTNN